MKKFINWFKSLFTKNESKYLDVLSKDALNDLQKVNKYLKEIVKVQEKAKSNGIEIDCYIDQIKTKHLA